MTGTDLPALNIADLQSLLRRREVSAREVIDALLLFLWFLLYWD